MAPQSTSIFAIIELAVGPPESAGIGVGAKLITSQIVAIGPLLLTTAMYSEPLPATIGVQLEMFGRESEMVDGEEPATAEVACPATPMVCKTIIAETVSRRRKRIDLIHSPVLPGE